jgi:hypothetical protein
MTAPRAIAAVVRMRLVTRSFDMEPPEKGERSYLPKIEHDHNS